MPRILLDTNAYSAFKAGEESALEVIRRAEVIGVPVVVLGELLGGFAAGSRETENRLELAQFLASPRVRVVPVDADNASHYGAVYAALRRKGQPIPTNDLWIAALALQHGEALFSLDAHFGAAEGLIVGRTAAELSL